MNYEEQANTFLKRNNISLSITYKKFGSMPWDNDGQKRAVYVCTLFKGDDRYIFDYGDSVANSCRQVKGKYMNGRKSQLKLPSKYDILASLSVFYFEDVDDVVTQLGEMKPSQAIAIFEQDQELRNFFSEKELEELNEIC